MVYPVLWTYYFVLWAVTLPYLCDGRLHFFFLSHLIVKYLVIFYKTRGHSWFLFCGSVMVLNLFCFVILWNLLSSEVILALNIKNTVLRVAIPHSLLGRCHHSYDPLPPSSRQKMLATSFLETFVPLYKTAVFCIQEDRNLNVGYSENLRSHIGNLLIGWMPVGICIGNGLLCNFEFIFSSVWAVMSVRMYWMRQCVSGGDRRVVDPETNLCWPHLLKTRFLSL